MADNGYIAELTHPHLPDIGTFKVPGKAIWFHGTPAGPPTTGELLGQSTAAVLHDLETLPVLTPEGAATAARGEPVDASSQVTPLYVAVARKLVEWDALYPGRAQDPPLPQDH